MRTTLDIDESVLIAVKELARRENRTAGDMASELIRRGLTQPVTPAVREPHAPHGFVPFPAQPGEPRVTNERVNQIREELGI